ncbi:MAG: caspase family protein [Vibrio gallaecicus]
MNTKLGIVASIAVAFTSSSFASNDLVDRISFNQLEKYHGIYKPGEAWTSITDGILDIHPWKQRWNIAGTAYTYSIEKGGYLYLKESSFHKGKIDPDKRYTISLKSWRFDKNSNLAPNLAILSDEGFTIFQKKNFGKIENIEFDVFGSQLIHGIKVINENVAIDNIHLKEEDTTKTDIINFEFLSDVKHGNTYNFSPESKGIAFVPVNQKAGTKNSMTFTYGNSSAYYRIYATDMKQIDPDATYRIEMSAGSSTTKAANKDLVQLAAVSRRGEAIKAYKGDDIFGVDWDNYAISVKGADLREGVSLRNSMVKMDNISIRKVGDVNIKKSLVVSTSDSNGNGDFTDIGDLIGSYNDGVSVTELATRAGYSTNYQDSISEANFVAALDKAVEQTDNDGVLFVYLAGHMSSQGEFSLADMQIPAIDIKERLDRHKGQKIVMFDSCASETALGVYKHDDNYIAISSSSENEFSWQGNVNYYIQGSEFAAKNLKKDHDGKTYMGDFTYYFTEGADLFFEQTLLADENFDGIITVQEAFDYAAPRTSAASDRYNDGLTQTPVIVMPKGKEGTPLFVFQEE